MDAQAREADFELGGGQRMTGGSSGERPWLIAGAPAAIPVLTEPTSEQRQAFDLIGAPIPLTLRK